MFDAYLKISFDLCISSNSNESTTTVIITTTTKKCQTWPQNVYQLKSYRKSSELSDAPSCDCIHVISIYIRLMLNVSSLSYSVYILKIPWGHRNNAQSYDIWFLWWIFDSWSSFAFWFCFFLRFSSSLCIIISFVITMKYIKFGAINSIATLFNLFLSYVLCENDKFCLVLSFVQWTLPNVRNIFWFSFDNLFRWSVYTWPSCKKKIHLRFADSLVADYILICVWGNGNYSFYFEMHDDKPLSRPLKHTAYHIKIRHLRSR